MMENNETSSIINVMPFYMALLLFEAISWSFIFKPNITKNLLKAISWNIKHLPDTLQQRVLVQSLRKINDKEIATIMVAGYCKLSIFQNIGVPSVASS